MRRTDDVMRWPTSSLDASTIVSTLLPRWAQLMSASIDDVLDVDVRLDSVWMTNHTGMAHHDLRRMILLKPFTTALSTRLHAQLCHAWPCALW